MEILLKKKEGALFHPAAARARTCISQLNLQKTARLISLFLILILTLASCATEEETAAQHMRTAEKYFADNQFKEAVLELKNVIQINPENDHALYMLGQTYMKLGEVDMATTYYASAVDANPDNLQAHFRMGQMYLAARNTMNARKAAKLILEKKPNDIEALHLLVAVQTQEKNTSAAIETIKRALAIDPGNIQSYLIMAQLLNSIGNMDEAEKTYLGAIAANPSAPAPYIKLIRFYGDNGRWNKSQSMLNQLGKETQSGHEELVNLAQFCERHRKWDLAEGLYRHAINHAAADETRPLLDLATHYARRGTPEKGLAVLQQALEIDGDNPDIITKLSQIHMAMGKMDQAEAAAKTALKIDSNHVSAHYIKGIIDFQKKDYTNALDRFEHVIKNTPNNPMAYYFKALCLLEKDEKQSSDTDLLRAAAGYHDEADTWLEKVAEENLYKAIELDPHLIPARLLLAEISLKNDNREKARAQIKAILARDPEHEKGLSLQGSLKILARDLSGAELICQKVLEKKPDSSKWHTRLGLVYALMKRPADALAACQKALELTPNQFDALQLIIDIKLGDKKYNEALAACEIQKGTLGEDSTAVAIIENMEGNIFLVQGKTQAAREHFQRAIAGAPDFLSPRMTLAKIAAMENDYDQAIEEYKGVLAVNGNYLPACMALGEFYYKKTEKKEAEKYFRRALKIKPGYGPAANNLAFILSFYENKVREAFDFAQLAARKMPDDPTVKDTLGWIHYRMGNYFKAVSELKRSLAINPDDALANYHIGLAYYQNKQFDAARKHLEMAIEINPGFEGADDARGMLD